MPHRATRGDRNEENPATENDRERLMHRACARTLSPRSFLLLEQSLQPTTSPLCGLAPLPLLNACSMYPGVQFLTVLDLKKLHMNFKKWSSVQDVRPLATFCPEQTRVLVRAWPFFGCCAF